MKIPSANARKAAATSPSYEKRAQRPTPLHHPREWTKRSLGNSEGTISPSPYDGRAKAARQSRAEQPLFSPSKGLSSSQRLFRSCEVSCHSITLYDMTRTRRASKVISVSLPPESARDFDSLAKEEGRNRSELFREMLRVYQGWRDSRRFEAFQRYGAAKAKERGITEKDIERLISEVRSE